MKPQTMLEFVLESNDLESIKNYAKFLSQKPEKWMFVPCDEEGNVLEEPKFWNKKYNDDIPESELILYEEYQQAIDRVIFEGFASVRKNVLQCKFLYFSMSEFRTIEKLIYVYGKYLTLKKPIL